MLTISGGITHGQNKNLDTQPLNNDSIQKTDGIRNSFKINFTYNYISNAQQQLAFSKTVGREVGIEYNRKVSNHFGVGINLSMREVDYVHVLPETGRFLGSGLDVAYSFGANVYYHFLPVPCSGLTGWNGYAVGRIGVSFSDYTLFQFSVGLGCEYFFTKRIGVFTETSWGNAFLLEINGTRNNTHLHLRGGLTYRF